MARALRLMVLASTLTGCQWLLGGGDSPAECGQDDDCFAAQICAQGACVTGSRPPADRGVALDAAADADGVDASLAVVDASPPDAALPHAPPFPEGRCFERQSDVFQANVVGDNHAPRGICTPWAVAWTAGRPGGAVLRLLTGPGGAADAVDGPAVAADTPLATDGRHLVVLGPWPAPDGPLTALRLDLATPSPEPLSETGRPHRDPARMAGLSGHVEGDADASWVVLTRDDDRFESCRRDRARQWGLALGGGRAAWFERAPGAVHVVVTDGPACAPAIRRAVDVADDARLVAAGGGFYWIGRGTTDVQGLSPDSRGRLRPRALAGDGPPVELAGGDGAWLAVVRYSPGRYVLDVVDLNAGEPRPISSASARRPTLSSGWLLWAEAAMFVPWELRYVDLATLR
ncbi:MAG: hypothetical protein H6706_11035 [Myxococcales bacterium]|nr:hypothetical protein [Myxococcales bacterium]